MKLENYDAEKKYMASIVSSTRITDESIDEVRELVMVVNDPDFSFQVGQNIGVIVDGPHELGHPEHFRLYSIADTPKLNKEGLPELRICVKRCDYIDEYSGERYQGTASNYLCDLPVGDSLAICGPFGLPFELPKDTNADLILVGMGTGIAPFRGFIKHIYHQVGDWKGKVYLFHGAQTGLELLYMNDVKDDISQYMDDETFCAVQVLSARPHWADPMALDYALEARADEMLKMLLERNASIYIAGRKEIGESLDRLFAVEAAPEEVWERTKEQLKDDGRWVELTY